MPSVLAGSAWPMCGRESELKVIGDVLAASESGGVLLAGPPGVGKTRVARETMRECRARGSSTAWVAATTTSAAIPFGPFAPLLPANCLSAGDRFGILARACRALAAMTDEGSPMVLGVDDAHLLDSMSAELVHQAVTRASMRLVATTRSGGQLPDPLMSLCCSGLVKRLELDALSRSVMESLVATVLGGPIVGSLLQQLWEISRGNALFVRELIEDALRTGSLVDDDGVWRLRRPLAATRGLIALVEQRLLGLSPHEQHAVESVAFAEPVVVELLHKIVPSADLESLERRGLIVVATESERLRVRLVHPLYAEAIRARIPVMGARRILADLAAASPPDDNVNGIDLLQIATWRMESGAECTSALLLKACARARSLFDLQLAERFARAAVHRHGGLVARRILGECLYAQGRFSEADEHLRGVTEEASTETDGALGAMSFASNLMWGLGREAEADQVLSDAMHATSDVAIVDEISMLRARVALASGRLQDSIEAASTVLHRPHAATAPMALSAAATLVPALAFSGRTAEALAIAERYLPLAVEHRDDEPRVLGMLIVGAWMARWFAGDLSGAATVAEELYGLATAAHSTEGISAGARSRGWTALAAGLPRTAMRWLHEAAATVPAGDINGLESRCFALLAEAAAMAGDSRAVSLLARAEAARRPALRIYDSQRSLAAAWVTAHEGNLAEAVSLVTTAGREAAEMGAHAIEAHLLHAAVRFGYPEAVAPRLAQLAEMTDGRWAPVFAAHAAALGARDGKRLEDVASEFEDIGARLLAAEACAGAANSYGERGFGRKRRAAAARATALHATCEDACTPALIGLDSPAPLTRREREIGALAARGLSSPEIAERLVVSVRTVEGHLYRLFTKLGVNRRDDLARRLGL